MKKTFFTFIIVFLILFSSINISPSLLFSTEEPEKPEIARLENGLVPTVRIKGQPTMNLVQRMMYHRVPGVSIAVIKDFKVDWAKGYGYKDFSTKEPVTDTPLFQAASDRQTVTAAVVMREFQEGKFKLDTDINQYLKSWKLPDHSFTAQTKVTIKNLLNHSGGITVHGFRGYVPGEPVPTFLQVLEGQAPANSSPIRVDTEIGKSFSYSGGGYCILQQILMDIEKKPFPELMNAIILTPLGMKDSFFQQPLTPEMETRAAVGHMAIGMPLPEKWHIYPELAAAGLWTTARDLATFAAELQLAIQNKSNKLLSQETAKLMLTPYVTEFNGLGFFIQSKNGSTYFHHGGANEGFNVFLIAHRDKGYGAVVMTNSDVGYRLYNEIIRGIADIYGWEQYLSEPYEPVTLTPDQRSALCGKYTIDSDHLLVITQDGERLYARQTFLPAVEILPISDSRCVRTDQDVIYEFKRKEGSPEVIQVIEHQDGKTDTYSPHSAETVIPGELILAGELDKGIEAYRQLFSKNPQDPNVSGMRLVQLSHRMILMQQIEAGVKILELTADLYPQLIKGMHQTLNTEVLQLLKHPYIPENVKTQIKEGYNRIMKKLELPELE